VPKAIVCPQRGELLRRRQLNDERSVHSGRMTGRLVAGNRTSSEVCIGENPISRSATDGSGDDSSVRSFPPPKNLLRCRAGRGERKRKVIWERQSSWSGSGPGKTLRPCSVTGPFSGVRSGQVTGSRSFGWPAGPEKGIRFP
jgi:hypothetical protein